jgi:catechol 2,3-dioxygenase-like lactoylglutathione lyase family enzyme
VSALLKSASIGAITLFTEDLDRSKQFYLEAFGLPVAFEDENSAVFGFGNTVINLLKIPAADELIEPGTVASREAGARFELTIGVDDVDAVCGELAKRGVTLLNGPMNRPWGCARRASPILAGISGRSHRTCPKAEAS